MWVWGQTTSGDACSVAEAEISVCLCWRGAWDQDCIVHGGGGHVVRSCVEWHLPALHVCSLTLTCVHGPPCRAAGRYMLTPGAVSLCLEARRLSTRMRMGCIAV